ncbi:hypothetical protein [Bacteroides acidifaciens]|jgi:hypothetical protein|uniref:hypothetical protein n=1 Tax=Bacteroides acidifaciens TaxID=85831 RepID=UPI00259B96E6|nr:hypothetical protein [Bacteroides acidifaciens]
MQTENIQMRLQSISEVAYNTDMSKICDDVNPDDLQVGFANKILPDIENNVISIVFGVQYLYENEKVLDCIYKFSFEVIDLSRYVIIDGDNITINHLMPHFLNVIIGTMRGILVVRTAGTLFSKYPLPILDANALNDSLSQSK